MMKYIYITIMLVFAPLLGAKDVNIESKYEKLLAICIEHSYFQPPSISFFESQKSKEYEKTYFKTVKYFHDYTTSEGIDFLLGKLKSGKSEDEKNCIKGMLNTWPG
jgi:hypothetical protein